MRFFIVSGLISLVAIPVFGADKPGKVGLLFEGHFEKADITSEVEGAKKTQLSAAYTWSYGVRLFTDKTWKERGMEWDDFSIQAGRLADELARKIKPEYVRNHRGVIDYAIVTGANPFFSSAITSPEFVKPFADTLGAKLHVIILDRNILYVFPAAGGKLSDYGRALVRLFKETPKPVSLEIFEVDRTGYRVVGEIERNPGEIQIEFGPDVTIETRD